jgi:glycosyltransferase involved in cell wall biosynthesis
MQVFQPAVGGVPTYVSTLARGLAERGWDVIVAGPADAVGMDELRDAGVRTEAIATQRNPHVRDRALAHELAAVARDADVRIVHGHSSKASVLSALAGRRAGIASVYTPHAWSFQMRHPLLVRAALAGTEAALTRMHEAVIAVCEAEAREARRWGVVREEQVRVVHTGLEADPPEVARALARARIGVRDGDVLIAWIGRKGPQKRPEDLAAIAPALPPQATVAALGHGIAEDRELAGALGAAGVRVLQGVDAPTLLAAADVFALTSAWEGFALAVLEAMRAGLPVVAYDAGGVDEQIRDGASGRIVDVGDTAGMAKAVSALVEDRGLRESMGRRGRQLFEDRFTLERMLDGVEETYAGVLARVTA